MKPTIHDVARQARVGIGTVSRVLNQQGEVSEATRQRVLQAIEELHYRPNEAARNLRSRRTRSIGVVAPFFTRPFYIEVLRGIERALQETTFSMVVFNIERREEHQDLFNSDLVNRVDGLLILSLTPGPDEIARLQEGEPPTVLLNCHAQVLPSIELDHVSGVRNAISHLVELGHERIGFIDHPENPFEVDRPSPRYEGYLHALDEHDLTPPLQYQLLREYSRMGGRDGGARLLSLDVPPTAIFAASDLMAIGVLETAEERGLRVPDDLAVVGYYDVELAAFARLTTVRMPAEVMGRRAVARLLEIMGGPREEPAHEVLRGELIVRHTSGA